MINDALLRQCVHCGLCLDACPTYVELGTEMDSPRGRIHLVEAISQGTLDLTPEVVRHMDLCLGCRACETACPAGVQYGQILEDARAHIEENTKRPLVQRLRRQMTLAVFPHPRRLRVFVTLVRWLQNLGLWSLAERWVAAASLFPRLHKAPSLQSTAAVGPETERVSVLRGCVADAVQPQVNLAAVRVLNRCGVSADVPKGQGCCGALHLHAGDREGAQRLARQNIDAFAGSEGSAVIVTAAGCGAAMKEYGELLADDEQYRTRAEQLSRRIRDVTEYIVEKLPADFELPGAEASVTYHDACHLAHGQGIREQPRSILRSIGGLTLTELGESDHCCGSAGSYNLTEPEMARTLAERKIKNIAATGAECVAVANPGCALQISAGLKSAGLSVRVVHPIELLDEAMAATASKSATTKPNS